MNIILMLIGVVIVYNILRITYRDNWSRNLSVDVTFSSNTATKGDTIKMVETVTNAKRMPLPCVNIKFSIDKNLVFGQEDNNSRITDKTYRNDVFSLLSNQRVTRKIDVLCARRGVYRLEAIDMYATHNISISVMILLFLRCLICILLSIPTLLIHSNQAFPDTGFHCLIQHTEQSIFYSVV